MNYTLPGWACEWWEKKKKQPKIKKSLLHLSKGSNPKKPWNARAAANVLGLSCHELIKVHVEGCSVVCCTEHPHYLLFLQQIYKSSHLNISSQCLDWKEDKKSMQLFSFFYWSTSFEHLLSLGGGWGGEPKNYVSFKSSHFWTEGDFHLGRVRKKFPWTGFSVFQPLFGLRCWTSSSQCWSGL